MKNKIRDENLLKDFGFHIRTLRQAKGMTLEDLAESSKIQYSQIIRVEMGKVNSTISTAQAIANGLGISLAELFTFKIK